MVSVYGGSGLGRCHLRQRAAGGERSAAQMPVSEADSISCLQREQIARARVGAPHLQRRLGDRVRTPPAFREGPA